jgi:renalase
VQLGAYLFDTGATSIAPRTAELERMMFQHLDPKDLVPVQQPIYVHESLRISRGDPRKNAIPRFAYRNGNAELARLLAKDFDVRLKTQVQELERGSDGYRVCGEAFEAVILTPPAPIVLNLLASIGEHRPLQTVTYRPCLSVLLGYDKPLPSVGYHALVEPEQRHPLTWLSLESEKAPGRAPENHSAIVAQMSPAFSRAHFESDETRIVQLVSDYIERLYGVAFATPKVHGLRRWLHSQAESFASFSSANPARTRIAVAGDGVSASRVEAAYESGVKAARILMS